MCEEQQEEQCGKNKMSQGSIGERSKVAEKTRKDQKNNLRQRSSVIRGFQYRTGVIQPPFRKALWWRLTLKGRINKSREISYLVFALNQAGNGGLETMK